MGNIVALARLTFSQCLRTKVAVVFAVVLAASLALLPSLMEGDGTLAGRIRTFLDYSTTVVSVLLSLVVVLLSVGVVSGDIRDKHVFVVCTKPLARWQYVVGRWLGVVLLNAMLLGGAGVGIYVLAQWLRGRTDLAFNAEDRRAVETEVFAARAEVFAEPPDVSGVVAERVRRKKADGTWDAAVESYRDNFKLTDVRAAEKLIEDMRKDAAAEAQSAGPGRTLSWNFRNIHVVGQPTTAGGVVRGLRRDIGLLIVQTDEETVARLLIFGPVWIDGRGGRVAGMWRDGFRVMVPLEDMNSPQMAGLRPGDKVTVAVEPTIQISYKVKGEAMKAAWKVENPTTGFVYDEPPRNVPINTRVTLIAPARAVDDQGRLRARFINYSPGSVTVLNRDVAVLYQVGAFEANFLKTFALMLMGLMFLAAMGIFAGSALSLPVGCLVCFVLLWVSTALRFLTEAITTGLEYGEKGMVRWLYEVGSVMLALMHVLLPDLATTLGTDYVVDGVVIPWGSFAAAAGLTVALRAGALLALACLIFHRRELARVQV